MCVLDGGRITDEEPARDPLSSTSMPTLKQVWTLSELCRRRRGRRAYRLGVRLASRVLSLRTVLGNVSRSRRSRATVRNRYRRDAARDPPAAANRARKRTTRSHRLGRHVDLASSSVRDARRFCSGLRRRPPGRRGCGLHAIRRSHHHRSAHTRSQSTVDHRDRRSWLAVDHPAPRNFS